MAEDQTLPFYQVRRRQFSAVMLFFGVVDGKNTEAYIASSL